MMSYHHQSDQIDANFVMPTKSNLIVITKSERASIENKFNESSSSSPSTSSSSAVIISEGTETEKSGLSFPKTINLDSIGNDCVEFLQSSTNLLPGDCGEPHQSFIDKAGENTDQNFSGLSDSLASLLLPNFAIQISSTIMNGLNWINQINATTLFQSFLAPSFLRRRFSQQSSSSSLQTETIKDDVDGLQSSSFTTDSLTFTQYKFAKLLNGTLRLPTLKPSELIELSSFGLVELDQDVEPGFGHEFQRYENDRTTWCDSCGEFLFPSLMKNDDKKNNNNIARIRSSGNEDEEISDASNTSSSSISMASSQTNLVSVQADQLIRTYFQCSKCKYVCHWKCLSLIRIDCKPPSPFSSSSSSSLNLIESKRMIDKADRNIIKSNTNNVIDNEKVWSQPTNIDSNNNQNDEHQNHNADHGAKISIQSKKKDDVLPNRNNADKQKERDINKITTDSFSKKNSSCDVIEERSSKHSNMDSNKIICDLRTKILRYNERVRSKGSGLGITLIDEEKGLFRGFLRVHMNLTRPINVIAGKRPPSIYDIINEEDNNQRRTLTSFYMPRDTVKNIHITSDNTSLQVIKAMLKKFKIVDNPQKFALYLRRRFPEEELIKLNGNETDDNNNKDELIDDSNDVDGDEKEQNQIKTFLRTAYRDHSLKRLHDQDKPLILQLEFDSFAYGSVDIVLQENDNADIVWDAFEIPELRNFLKILEREESQHLQHVKAHYDELRRVMRILIEHEERRLLLKGTMIESKSIQNHNSTNDLISL
ncbi:Ras association domain-containing protein 5 [Sarcoptes scabiei]|uniref:Ras association domain-containing protein 5 n=1 Tax=Sarcoptes scabiei TaxID=52283 RepID=A0A834R3Q1_SARSC|nr:Ras association domain-containing protein 5 [Sarcoptes scabiei]